MNAMTTVKTFSVLLAGAVILAFAASPAYARNKRTYSETGPLIMSGTMAPPVSSRRARAPDKCVPVTVKRRPLLHP